MSHYLIYPENKNIQLYAFAENVFSNEECDKIINLGRGSGLLDSLVAVADEKNDSISKPSIRKSKQAWLEVNDQSLWIYDRLANIATIVNKQFWGFELKAFLDPLQFTEYGRGHFYDWHKDFGPGRTLGRKLSIVVQLTDPKDYEGGEFQFFDKSANSVPKTRGSVIFFPSFEVHKVSEIEFGLRNSLVGWISGEFYR